MNKDERIRPPLRLVVNNVEKRITAAGESDDENFLAIGELIEERETLRAEFYAEMRRQQQKAFFIIERVVNSMEWRYGLDPHHGHLMVIPSISFLPALEKYGAMEQDEVLVAVTDDPLGDGLCLSLEMALPFYDDDPSVMEDSVLYSPILQFGTLFLEENRQGYLTLIYRVAIPLYPPALTIRIAARFFATAVREVSETLQALAEYPPPS